MGKFIIKIICTLSHPFVTAQETASDATQLYRMEINGKVTVICLLDNTVSTV
jgi:hypothetical protein